MAIQQMDIESRLTEPATYTAYDRSFTATDYRQLARDVYNQAYFQTSTATEYFVELKTKFEELLDTMDNAIVVDGEVFLKSKAIYLYELIPKLMENVDNKFTNYAVEPAIQYCNQQQRISNQRVEGQANAYRNQVEAEQATQAAQAQQSQQSPLSTIDNQQWRHQ